MFVTARLKEDVGQILERLEGYANWLAESTQESTDWSQDSTHVMAAERALHIAVELCTDAANAVIDALVMRDAGGYADIIRVLMEEEVVDKEWFSAFEGVLQFRQRLIHDYLHVEAEEVMTAVSMYTNLFPVYIEKLRAYLQISP